MEFEWNEAKNHLLQSKGRPSFDDVAFKVGTGYLLGTIQNPSLRYPNQLMLVVQVESNIWVVPYEKRAGKIRLITVFHHEAVEEHFRGKMQ